MIVLPPGFFCPKLIVCFIYPVRNLRVEVKYFRAKLSSPRSLSTLWVGKLGKWPAYFITNIDKGEGLYLIEGGTQSHGLSKFDIMPYT